MVDENDGINRYIWGSRRQKRFSLIPGSAEKKAVYRSLCDYYACSGGNIILIFIRSGALLPSEVLDFSDYRIALGYDVEATEVV